MLSNTARANGRHCCCCCGGNSGGECLSRCKLACISQPASVPCQRRRRVALLRAVNPSDIEPSNAIRPHPVATLINNNDDDEMLNCLVGGARFSVNKQLANMRT